MFKIGNLAKNAGNNKACLSEEVANSNCRYLQHKFWLSMAQHPLMGQGLLIIQTSRSHSR